MLKSINSVFIIILNFLFLWIYSQISSNSSNVVFSKIILENLRTSLWIMRIQNNEKMETNNWGEEGQPHQSLVRTTFCMGWNGKIKDHVFGFNCFFEIGFFFKFRKIYSWRWNNYRKQFFRSVSRILFNSICLF